MFSVHGYRLDSAVSAAQVFSVLNIRSRLLGQYTETPSLAVLLDIIDAHVLCGVGLHAQRSFTSAAEAFDQASDLLEACSHWLNQSCAANEGKERCRRLHGLEIWRAFSAVEQQPPSTVPSVPAHVLRQMLLRACSLQIRKCSWLREKSLVWSWTLHAIGMFNLPTDVDVECYLVIETSC